MRPTNNGVSQSGRRKRTEHLCRYCNENLARENGLCFRCQRNSRARVTPDPEELLKLLSSLRENTRPLAPEPTKHLPGTAGKVEVMRIRHMGGYAIFHPDDATVEGSVGVPDPCRGKTGYRKARVVEEAG